MRRAQTIPPPKPKTDTVKNALAMAPSGARVGCCSGRAADINLSVLMPVMQVGIMRVLVDETAMLVRMAVRFAIRIGWRMDVLMMRVVHMPVLVNKRLVHMLVLMFFGKMQIHARRHERGSRDQRPCDGFAEQRNRDRGADKGSDRKIRPGPGRTEMTQSQYEERKANAITEETDDSGRGKGPLFGQLRTMGKAQRSIDDAGGNTLDHGDLERIGGAELSGQVVIDTAVPLTVVGENTMPAPTKSGLLRA